MKKLLFYLPRILSLIIVIFFAVFILEGIGPDFTWRDSLMHFLLTLVVLAVTLISWKRSKIGGWLFILLGLFWLITLHALTNSIGMIIGGVHLITGLLFLFDY